LGDFSFVYSELVEIIVFEGANVKVWLKVSQKLVIRNFLQAVKHGILFMEQMQVSCSMYFC